ncbi:MAG: orotidine-5'-phosphate decarboxylase [Candidatus Dormibacteria bacterium]
MSREPFSDRLAARGRELGSALCLGLDPTGCRDAAEVERFCAALLEAALPYVVAVKPNLAFFEQHGSAGLQVLERVRERIPGDRLVILDAKRGDIGSTAQAQARALFDVWEADAVTVNPLLGRDSVAPFLERPGTAALLLARTSNPGAADFLEAPLEDGRPLYRRIVERALGWPRTAEIGFVVGATAPGAIAEIRALAPHAPLLLPGVGAQGGDLEAAVRAGLDGRGGGIVVPVSRGISGAADPRAAALELSRRIEGVRTPAPRQ